MYYILIYVTKIPRYISHVFFARARELFAILVKAKLKHLPSISAMDHLSTKQRTEVMQFYLETKSIILTQRKFKRHFSTRAVHTRKIILRIAEKFIAFVTVQNQNKKNTGPKRTVSTSATVKELKDTVRLACLERNGAHFEHVL